MSLNGGDENNEKCSPRKSFLAAKMDLLKDCFKSLMPAQLSRAQTVLYSSFFAELYICQRFYSAHEYLIFSGNRIGEFLWGNLTNPSPLFSSLSWRQQEHRALTPRKACDVTNFSSFVKTNLILLLSVPVIFLVSTQAIHIYISGNSEKAKHSWRSANLVRRDKFHSTGDIS